MLLTRGGMRSIPNASRIITASRIFMQTTNLNASPSSASLRRSFTTGRFTGFMASQMDQQQSTATITAKKADAVIFLNVTPRNDDFMIEVKWKDECSTKYPNIWLRDNCQCSKCFHPTAESRRVTLQELDISVTATSLKVNEANDDLEIDWSDGHKGRYPANWLQDRSFTDQKREQRQKLHRFNRSYWGSEIINQLPQAKYSELIKDDRALLEFLMNLEEFGLVLVRDTPLLMGEIAKLSNRVGFLKRTHYGLTFSVKQKIDANNLAYTSDSLNLHVDMPYLHYKPGVQLLHCISQVPTEGGANHLVDSFHVANQLRDRYPEKFKSLATTLVDFVDYGVEEDGFHFDAHAQEPMIVLDRLGLINTVNFNHMVRDSHFDISVEKVKDWYDAMLTFHSLLYHPDNLITYKMKEGDIMVFDNNRVMHGRTGYKMTEGSRELEGCYWDWDVVKSCRRVLKTKLGMSQ